MTPGQTAAGAAGVPLNALPQKDVLDTVEANWVNGVDLASQKAIAKSLIKLNLSPGNAPALAAKTNVDAALLATLRRKWLTAGLCCSPRAMCTRASI